jgi:hypothetical protein
MLSVPEEHVYDLLSGKELSIVKREIINNKYLTTKYVDGTAVEKYVTSEECDIPQNIALFLVSKSIDTRKTFMSYSSDNVFNELYIYVREGYLMSLDFAEELKSHDNKDLTFFENKFYSFVTPTNISVYYEHFMTKNDEFIDQLNAYFVRNGKIDASNNLKNIIAKHTNILYIIYTHKNGLDKLYIA